MSVDIQAAALQASDPVQIGIRTIPHDVWNAIYTYVRNVAQIADPFTTGASCWKLACYLGIASVECGGSFYMGVEGDAADDAWSGPAATCCSYYNCLTNISCSSFGYSNAWEAARAHAPYGANGAYLSHGIFQLYVCGQGAGYICEPARLHEVDLHMDIALPPIGNAIVSNWNEGDLELSVRMVSRAAGHPGWADLYHQSYTNIWNETEYLEPFLYNYLLGYEPDPEPEPPDNDFPPSPLPLFPAPSGTPGGWPLPPFP